MSSSTIDWQGMWEEMVKPGGPLRWKDGELAENYKLEADVLARCASAGREGEAVRLLVPLSGDCRLVSEAAARGMHVTAVELVPTAVQSLRASLGDDCEWTRSDDDDGVTTWTSQRVTIVQADFFRPSLAAIVGHGGQLFDAVFDKDAFGAIEPEDRERYVDRCTQMVRPGGVLLLEGKNKGDHQADIGPPYHIDEDVVARHWRQFTVEARIPDFYAISNPHWKQSAFVLRRSLS